MEIFSSGKIHCSGAPIAAVVAETPESARAAAAAVRVTYKNERAPVLTIRDALQEPGRVTTEGCGPVYSVGEVDIFDDEKLESALAAPVRVVRGEFEIGSQHHLHIETHTTLVRPMEDGMYEVHCATQWINMTQELIAKALAVPINMFEMKASKYMRY